MPPHASRVEVLSRVRAVDFENEWYDAATAEHFWMEWRFRALLRFIDACGPARDEALQVLEVGGGHGVARRQIEAATRWTVDLTDLNVDALERGVRARGRTLYYDITDREPSMRERYDAILLLDVLEHIDATRPFLDALAWHLTPGGTLLINVPALPAFYSAYDRVLGHCRRYTRASLQRDCTAAGFSCRAVRFWGVTLLPFLAARAVTMRRLSDDPAERAAIARRGMMPPGRVAAGVFRMLMGCETRIFGTPPLGTSLLCAALKPHQ